MTDREREAYIATLAAARIAWAFRAAFWTGALVLILTHGVAAALVLGAAGSIFWAMRPPDPGPPS